MNKCLNCKHLIDIFNSHSKVNNVVYVCMNNNQNINQFLRCQKRRITHDDDDDDDDDVLVPHLLSPGAQLIGFYLQHPKWICTVYNVRSSMENPGGLCCPSKTPPKNSELRFLNH